MRSAMPKKGTSKAMILCWEDTHEFVCAGLELSYADRNFELVGMTEEMLLLIRPVGQKGPTLRVEAEDVGLEWRSVH